MPDRDTSGSVDEPVLSDDDTAAAGSLEHYLRIVRRRRLILLLVLAAALAAAAAASYRQQPLYEAQSKIVIGQGNTLFQVQNSNSIQPFTATMSDLLTSNIVAERVSASLGLKQSPTALLKNVSVSINPQTAVIKLSVTDHSARRAQQISAEFGAVFALLVQERFGRANATTVNRQAPISASVFDPAHVLPGRISPTPVRNLVIAAVLGLLLGLAAAFLRDHFDSVLRTDKELEAAFDSPVIGRIPARRGSRRRPWGRGRGDVDGVDLDGVWDERREAAEAYRMLRAMLRSRCPGRPLSGRANGVFMTHGPRAGRQLRAAQRPLRTLLVTSVTAGSGKEAVAANLACAFARAGSRTLLVEADLHQPLLDEAIGHGTIGLTGVLAGCGALSQAVEADVGPPRSQGLGPARLDFLSSGTAPAHTSDLLASARMVELIVAASGYEYLLLDAPPLLLAADALDLARAVDGVIFVTRRDQTRSDQAREIRALVDRLDIYLAGLVLTGTDGGVGGMLDSAALPARSDSVALRAAAGGVSDR